MDATTLRRMHRHTYAPRRALPGWLIRVLRWL